MERVTLLVEETGVRLSCLLNPETLIVRRVAGVRPRRSLGGPLTGAGLSDTPLLFTGGGMTELQLDLLFDVDISRIGSTIVSENVRELTAPFFALTENLEESGGHPPLVRFVWGKSWNVPGVVAAVAERLEFFTPAGEPRRSWLRMRLVRASEEAPRAPAVPSALQHVDVDAVPAMLTVPEERVHIHEVLGGPAGAGGGEAPGERLEEIAQRYYGNPALWRLLAAFNGIFDPLRLTPGQLLRIPPLRLLTESR